jgi:hypothetical protein
MVAYHSCRKRAVVKGGGDGRQNGRGKGEKAGKWKKDTKIEGTNSVICGK